MYDVDLLSEFGRLWQSSQTFIYVIVSIGIFGNLLVILSVIGFHRMKTATNVYLCNLALVDIISLLSVPLIVGHLVNLDDDVSCRLYTSGKLTATLTGAFTLAILTADTYSYKSDQSGDQSRCLTSVALVNVLLWVMCALFAGPLAYFTESRFDKTSQQITCQIFWPDMKQVNGQTLQSIYVITIGFLAPLVFILLFQCLIACGKDESGKVLPRKRQRPTFLVGCLCFFYILCRLPYWALLYLHSNGLFGSDQQRSVSDTYWKVATIVGVGFGVYLNSALNPILFPLVNQDFASSYCRIIFCGCFCKHSGHNGSKSDHQDRNDSLAMEPSHSFVFSNEFQIADQNKPKIFIDYLK